MQSPQEAVGLEEYTRIKQKNIVFPRDCVREENAQGVTCGPVKQSFSTLELPLCPQSRHPATE